MKKIETLMEVNIRIAAQAARLMGISATMERLMNRHVDVKVIEIVREFLAEEINNLTRKS